LEGEVKTFLRRVAVLGLIVSVGAVAAATAAASPGTVAAGLANPRGISVGPGGRLLVVESATGAIDVLRKGSRSTLATLPGAVDVATNGLGNTYAVIGGPDPDAPPPPPGPAPPESLVRVSPSGKVDLVADIGKYVAAHPDPEDLDQPPNPTESNPNGLALLGGGDVLVADAAANRLLHVDQHGTITTAARFRPETVPWGLPFGPPIGTPVPAEAVPTAVAVGPDGAYYVSELTGFPFSNGVARIWRIAPGSVDALCDPAHPATGPCTSVATGFSSVIDLAFGRDGTMYVLEIAKNGLAGALVLGTEFPPIGALWAVKNGVRTLVSDALVAPGGVAVGDDGTVYVTTDTFGPPGGSVVAN
jgi:sugar lactone lactonase YvrE